MSINVNDKNLGHATAYAYYKAGGGTMTEAEFTEFMADFGTASQTAVEAAQAALASETAASTAATTATNKATEATTAATTATSKAAEASTSASTATSAKDTAVSASQTATTKATEATTAAATATSAATTATTAKDDAVSAKTAAQTAQTGAETAAASVSASAAQIATNAEDISQLKSGFADMQSDGVVPSAEQILTDKGITDSVPYHYRKTGGDGADRLYDQIVGGTVCWNQFYDPSGVTTVTTNGVTFTKNADGSISVSGTATADVSLQLVGALTVVVNHKMLIKGCPSDGAFNTYSISTVGYSEYGTGLIVNNTANLRYVWIRIGNGTTITTPVVFRPQIFDLTVMFGSTIADYIYQLEQTTAGAGVAFFKALFPNDYYEYNAGELVSVSGLSEHKMVGFNQWDEEWELGTLPSVQPSDSTTRIRSKDFCICLSNTAYYFNAPKNGTIYWYDADENYISYNVGNNAEYTSPANARFFKIAMGDQYGATYNHDICINLSDPTKNGTYKPYKAHSYPLDSNLTLRGVPKIVDGKMCFDGDTYESDGTVTRRYGVVDLGTLTWSLRTDIGQGIFSTTDGAINYVYRADVGMICPTYQYIGTVGAAALMNNFDKAMGSYYSTYETSHVIYIKDSSYTDATALKTAMSGVMLVYELATPTTEEADPYQHIQQCDPNGTEEYVSTGIVPVGHNSFYPENLRAKIEQLPWNFANLIAPTESAFVATRNYTTGSLFIVDNVLYKATSNIANGGTITPNTNCTATTLAEIISALA